jgi:hypothetical protein
MLMVHTTVRTPDKGDTYNTSYLPAKISFVRGTKIETQIPEKPNYFFDNLKKPTMTRLSEHIVIASNQQKSNFT